MPKMLHSSRNDEFDLIFFFFSRKVVNLSIDAKSGSILANNVAIKITKRKTAIISFQMTITEAKIAMKTAQ